MKIGDTVTCIDADGSENLGLYKEYVIVDINGFGNLGLKDPAKGMLLEHYYRPCRFKVYRKPIEICLWVNDKTNQVCADGTLALRPMGTTDGTNTVRLFREVIQD